MGARARRGGATGQVAAIPDKEAFRIGEVATLVGVAPSVLRFWEGEFPSLRPTKTRAGQRLYRRADIEKVLRIRELLYGRGFTIAGARAALRGEPDLRSGDLVQMIRREVQDLLRVVGE